MKKILFVCTGNTCRSPMAEALLRNMSEFEVKSAGVFANDGGLISSQAKEVLEEKGIKCDHQSNMLTKNLVDWADLILTMTTSHKQFVLQSFPEATSKVYTLKEYTNKDTAIYDISDPFGAPVEVYRTTAAEIERELERLIRKLNN